MSSHYSNSIQSSHNFYDFGMYLLLGLYFFKIIYLFKLLNAGLTHTHTHTHTCTHIRSHFLQDIIEQI